MTIPTTCPQRSRPLTCPINWPSASVCFEFRRAGLPVCMTCNVSDAPRDPAACRANVSMASPSCLRCSVGQEVVRSFSGACRTAESRGAC